MKTAVRSIAAVVAAGVLMVASVSTTAMADPVALPPLDAEVDAQDLADGTLILRVPGEAPYVVPEIDDVGLLPPSDPDDGVISPRSVGDTALNARCVLPGAMNHVIDKYPSKSHGTISFHCGNSKFGYKHIRAQHPESQWRAQMGGKGPWTAYMRYLQRSALKSPNKMRNQSGGKACYSTPVQVYRLVNGTSKYWKTINPSVVISKNNKRIITSIPSKRGAC